MKLSGRRWMGAACAVWSAVLLAAVLGCGGRRSTSKDATTSSEAVPATPSGHLELGAATTVATQQVPPEGGVIAVQGVGPTVDGLTLTVEAGAYPEARTFDISAQPILAHDFGADVTPLSPLITIGNGGGYAERPMVLRVPVVVPQGWFAMGFMYDPTTGELEGMPLLDAGPDHVTLLALTFGRDATAPSGRTRGALRVQSGALGEDDDAVKVFISAAPETQLVGEFETAFAPGVDDLPAANNGTFVSPGGVCAGSTVGAIWYFTEMRARRGAPPIRQRVSGDGHHDLPSLGNDDVAAARFASMVQLGFGAHGFIDIIELIVQSALKDDVTMLALKYAMKLTRAPQVVGVMRIGEAHHAVVAYGVSGDRVRVADPNHSRASRPAPSTTIP